jgi:hypothetical protein
MMTATAIAASFSPAAQTRKCYRNKEARDKKSRGEGKNKGEDAFE